MERGKLRNDNAKSSLAVTEVELGVLAIISSDLKSGIIIPKEKERQCNV